MRRIPLLIRTVQPDQFTVFLNGVNGTDGF